MMLLRLEILYYTLVLMFPFGSLIDNDIIVLDGSFQIHVFIVQQGSFASFVVYLCLWIISDLRGLLKPLILLMVMGLFLSLNHLFVIVLIKFHGSFAFYGFDIRF